MKEPEERSLGEALLGSYVLDFELASILGSGGMSVVYRGRHRVTGQEVAIKILPPELAIHDELKARFIEEAKVLAKLEHPNIVSLNNFTETNGRLCLIMQYVAGSTFEQQIVERGPLPVKEVVRIGIEVLQALEHAHAQQIVHRDIKPSNVLIRRDGSVKVTDFGIAKMLGNSRLTSTGQTMGTVRYMSPEQVRGRALDARSDLYSLGITLYEALAGRPPFDGETQFEIMKQQIEGRVAPIRNFGVAVPAAVERALHVALAKDADERYADAKAFRTALEGQALELREPSARQSRPPRAARARRLLGLALCLALGLAVVVTIAVVRSTQLGRLGPAVQSRGAVLSSTTEAPTAAAPSWPAPQRLPGVRFAVDQTFPAARLRVQSTSPRSADELRAHVVAIVAALRTFLAKAKLPTAPHLSEAAPLNLVVLPESLLDRADLWPGYVLTPGSTYPSRYVASNQTLFMADSTGFEERELPYGIALHLLAPHLSDADCLTWAERFQRTYLSFPQPGRTAARLRGGRKKK